MFKETSSDSEASYLQNTFSWIDDGRLLAGSSCPGLNSSMGVDALYLKNICCIDGVVSLNDAELDWSPLIDIGMKQLSIGVSDYKPPTIEQMKDIVAFIERLGDKSRVLVHCNAGMGRTGTVLAGLLVYKYDIAVDDAIKQVRGLRRGSVQTYKQVSLLLVNLTPQEMK
jgi:atypical dual specificity phosphatase